MAAERMTRALHPVGRRATALACAAACALLPVACGSGSGSGSLKGKTLTVQLYPVTIDAAGYNKYHKALADAFFKATGAHVKYVTTAESTSEQFPQIEASHSGPDIMLASASGSAYASGAFVHLSQADWKVVGGQKQMYPHQLASSGPSGGPYDQVPMYNVPYTMVYNTALFKKAGISHPPKTWTEYVDDAQKINDPSAGVYGTGFDPSDTQNGDTWKIGFYLSANYGGALYANHDQGSQPTITSGPVKNAYQFWFDWYRKFHIVNPDSLSWQEPQLQAAFAAGKIGELPGVKSQYIPLYQSGKMGHNFAFAPMPSVPYEMNQLPPGGTAPESFLSEDGLYIGTYAPLKLALQYAKIMLEPKYQIMQYQLTGNLPVTTAAGSAVQKSASSLLQPFFEALPSEQPEPFSVTWNAAQLAINAMTAKLASTLATTHHLTNAQIATELANTQASIKSH